MDHNTIDNQEAADRFLRRVAETEVVWYLSGVYGTAYRESGEETADGSPAIVLLFFSEESLAQGVQEQKFAKYTVVQMSLFEFLIRWLPGMANDGARAGPDWNSELTGAEFDPNDLGDKIDSLLSEEQRAEHEARFRDLAH